MTSIPFAREDELCAVLARHLDRVLLPGSNPRHVQALEQRSVGAVIPDFIYIRSHRLADSQPTAGLTAIEASIVATLAAEGGLSGVNIADRLYSRIERLAPHLNTLQRVGIVREIREGVFALRAGVLPRSAHVVAVEAKLRRWKDAIHQAATYLRFANQAYVALPAAILSSTPAIAAEATAKHVGLLSVDADNVTISRPSPRGQAHSADWVWLLSRSISFGSPTT